MRLRVEAPAKLNIALHVEPPRSDGMHPLLSLVQTIEWCDSLAVSSEADEDNLAVVGGDAPTQDNILWRVLETMRQGGEVPPLELVLHKEIPMQAGLGGGSSDAAALVRAAVHSNWIAPEAAASAAVSAGADVPLFLEGGSLVMSGIGENISRSEPLDGFVVAVVVPPFGLSTADVYRTWDAMEGPEGEIVPGEQLPPALRDGMPIRNDLLPAALSVAPELGDFMSDVRATWSGPVLLTGSGSGCFGFFAGLDEAADAVGSVSGLTADGRGVALRPKGATVLEDL